MRALLVGLRTKQVLPNRATHREVGLDGLVLANDAPPMDRGNGDFLLPA